MATPNNKLTISRDNPFRERIITAVHANARQGEGYIAQRRVTIEDTIIGFNGPWIKMYQNKEMLSTLSPEACKIMIFIALNMKWNEEKIKIPQETTGLSRRLYPRAIQELIANNVIRKERQNTYWVNLTLLIIGHVDKPDLFEFLTEEPLQPYGEV